MSRQELHRRLKAVDPNLTIISGHPYILKPDEARGRGLPDLPGRTPPAEILELEGQYSLKALRTMASENNLSPEGDKEMLVRRLLKKGVLKIARGQGILMQTKPAERMPRIDPHASVLKQDQQLRKQIRWLKQHGFKTAREAQEAGY